MPNTHSYALRLKPGADLKISVLAFVAEHTLTAAWISCCAGSLTKYNIRFANQSGGTMQDGHFEIICLTGTLSVNGAHLHIAVSDSTGKTVGGHLLEGCIIYTTAEIIIQSSDELIFRREKDDGTGWKELLVKNKKQS